MPHKPVKFPQLSEEKKPWTIFEFTIFIVLSINERRSNSKTHGFVKYDGCFSYFLF